MPTAGAGIRRVQRRQTQPASQTQGSTRLGGVSGAPEGGGQQRLPSARRRRQPSRYHHGPPGDGKREMRGLGRDDLVRSAGRPGQRGDVGRGARSGGDSRSAALLRRRAVSVCGGVADDGRRLTADGEAEGEAADEHEVAPATMTGATAFLKVLLLTTTLQTRRLHADIPALPARAACCRSRSGRRRCRSSACAIPAAPPTSLWRRCR